MKHQRGFNIFLAIMGAWIAIAEVQGSDLSTSATLMSPTKAVRLDLKREGSRLMLSVQAHKWTIVLDPSPLTFMLDGKDLAKDAVITASKNYSRNEKYPWRGAHALAVDRSNGMVLLLKSPAGKCTLEIRAFDDGVAYRFISTAEAKMHVPDETSTFNVPAGSMVWYHDLAEHYEGIYQQAEVEHVKAGEWAAAPMTFKLPREQGYAAITEANLVDYPGMALQADGDDGFSMRLAPKQPMAKWYPRKHTPEQVKQQTEPAPMLGQITTPWRVVIYGRNLNEMVNSDIVPDLCPEPDRALFLEGMAASWIKPGRAVWRYLDGGIDPSSEEATNAKRSSAGVSAEEAKLFSKYGAQLGFEYNVLENYWHSWSEAELRDVVDYSRKLGVGIWAWEFSGKLMDAQKREAFFAKLERMGIVGAKVDFFDSESKETIDLYRHIMVDAAKHHIMLDFHGANKPTGLSRTYPNLLTSEAVKGLEDEHLTQRARHETILPFTRLLAGSADYTVLDFGARRGDTTVAHQVASAAILSAPLLTYTANPKKILDCPARGMIESIPPVWDETRVLPPSEIGELAIYARRSGETWFLAVMNGPTSRHIEVPLSFLPAVRTYDADVVRDAAKDASKVETQHYGVTYADGIMLDLQPGGGFIARLTPHSAR